LTACSKDVTVGITGPIGSGLPQFGFPRRFAIKFFLPRKLVVKNNSANTSIIPLTLLGFVATGAGFSTIEQDHGGQTAILTPLKTNKITLVFIQNQ
jgi:hypothetical protein